MGAATALVVAVVVVKKLGARLPDVDPPLNVNVMVLGALVFEELTPPLDSPAVLGSVANTGLKLNWGAFEEPASLGSDTGGLELMASANVGNLGTPVDATGDGMLGVDADSPPSRDRFVLVDDLTSPVAVPLVLWATGCTLVPERRVIPASAVASFPTSVVVSFELSGVVPGVLSSRAASADVVTGTEVVETEVAGTAALILTEDVVATGADVDAAASAVVVMVRLGATSMPANTTDSPVSVQTPFLCHVTTFVRILLCGLIIRAV